MVEEDQLIKTGRSQKLPKISKKGESVTWWSFDLPEPDLKRSLFLQGDAVNMIEQMSPQQVADFILKKKKRRKLLLRATACSKCVDMQMAITQNFTLLCKILCKITQLSKILCKITQLRTHFV